MPLEEIDETVWFPSLLSKGKIQWKYMLSFYFCCLTFSLKPFTTTVFGRNPLSSLGGLKSCQEIPWVKMSQEF